MGSLICGCMISMLMSKIRLHTILTLVVGLHTCALPIYLHVAGVGPPIFSDDVIAIPGRDRSEIDLLRDDAQEALDRLGRSARRPRRTIEALAHHALDAKRRLGHMDSRPLHLQNTHRKSTSLNSSH